MSAVRSEVSGRERTLAAWAGHACLLTEARGPSGKSGEMGSEDLLSVCARKGQTLRALWCVFRIPSRRHAQMDDLDTVTRKHCFVHGQVAHSRSVVSQRSRLLLFSPSGSKPIKRSNRRCRKRHSIFRSRYLQCLSFCTPQTPSHGIFVQTQVIPTSIQCLLPSPFVRNPEKRNQVK